MYVCVCVCVCVCMCMQGIHPKSLINHMPVFQSYNDKANQRNWHKLLFHHTYTKHLNCDSWFCDYLLETVLVSESMTYQSSLVFE